MNKLIENLNKQIADWSVLYVKLHHFHWYVKGEHFFTLHEKFEEYYNEAAERVDELAERVLSINGKPVATMKEYLALTSIDEANGTESMFEMVAIIAADFEKMLGDLKAGISLAQEQGDESTADMLIAIHTELEKHIWMLKAFNA